jgi:hypothetical protein
MLPARKPSILAAAFFDISGPDMVTGGDEHVLAVTTYRDLCACSEPITLVGCMLIAGFPGILQDRQPSVAAQCERRS